MAWALPGGAGVFLAAAAAISLRTAGQRSVPLIVGGALCLCAGAVVVVVPALVALVALAGVVAGVLVLEGRRAVSTKPAPPQVS